MASDQTTATARTEPPVPRGHDARVAAAYERLRPGLTRVAYLLTFDAHEAHDVVQECFLAALPRWDSIDDHDAYLRRAVTNRAYTATRDRGRRQAKDRRHQAEWRGDVGEAEYLADAIAALPAKERAVVVLRYHLDCSTAEIADALDMRPGSVGPTLTRALRRLEEALTS
jgi:RNA polymerase sigma factor (sigma-70 family)